MLPTAKLSLSCSFADRIRAARFAVRATRRAGGSRTSALASAAGLLARGRADLQLRTNDADLYLALGRRELAPQRVLASMRAAAALGAA